MHNQGWIHLLSLPISSNSITLLKSLCHIGDLTECIIIKSEELTIKQFQIGKTKTKSDILKALQEQQFLQKIHFNISVRYKVPSMIQQLLLFLPIKSTTLSKIKMSTTQTKKILNQKVNLNLDFKFQQCHI